MNSDPSLTTAPPLPDVIGKLLADKADLANQVQGLMLQVEGLKIEYGKLVWTLKMLQSKKLYKLSANIGSECADIINAALAQAAGITEEK